MILRRISAVVCLAAIGLLLTAVPSSAAAEGWSGSIDSGGRPTVFVKQRVATRQVLNTVTGTAEAGITLVSCTDETVIVSGEWRMPLGVQRTFGATTNRCFRQQIRRWTPRDTNGALPGFGVTGLNGEIIW